MTKSTTSNSAPPASARGLRTGKHKLPADFRAAIDSYLMVKEVWADITPLARNEWICWVTSAKKDETRSRRIAVGLDKMRQGLRRPCCWAGCPHR